jgi:membrane associated rhomboid family serine protease
MSSTGITGLLIIAINILVSYRGFKSPAFLDRYAFEVDKILVNKEYWRLITSGFLHVSWLHLIFNMLSLYFFSSGIEYSLGEVQYLAIYFASLIGGNLLALFIHRYHGDYSAVGASGAVCGVIFACIALFPGFSVGLFIISLPGWLYGLVFVLGSIYGIRSSWLNVGHDAHLGGALVGMLTAIAMSPSSLMENLFPILVVLIPSLAFIYIIITRPHLLFVDNLFFNTNNKNYTVDHRYNMQKVDKQKEIDRILDKINRTGMKSLTSKERQDLKEYSKVNQ